MKRIYCALLLLSLSACHLAHPLTQAQVVTILTDAGYGVGVGCGAGWLNLQECTIAKRILADAREAAEAAVDGWQAAAKAVLVTDEAQMPPDDKLRPYFDAAIALL
jgi:hypothetical protein